jgi:ribosomal protein L29
MIDFQNLNNLSEINYKSKGRPDLTELAEYIDHLKADLFNDKWSQATKKHSKSSLVLYIRTMQKQLAPMGYHYKSENIVGKQHLEHVIPQNKIITAYLHDMIPAKIVLQMPLCVIDDADKHILEGDWQTSGNWQYPFRRYKLAGFTKPIKDVRGKIVDLDRHTLQDHFKMLGTNERV